MAVCVSYPKSGRTWLRTMLGELGISMEFTHLDTGANSSAWGKPLRKLCTPQVEDKKIVFLHRDPRDTVVSFFHEATLRQKHNLRRSVKYWIQNRTPPREMDKFVRSDRFGIEKVIVFNLRCAENLDALPIAYEDLRSDTIRLLSTIVSYVGEPLPESLIREVVENNKFARMQAREARNEYKGKALQARDLSNKNSFKVRRGKVGGWADELDLDTQSYANMMLDKYRYFDRIRELTRK